MQFNKREKQLTIKGIVTAVDWGKNGNANRVAVCTANEKEYLVTDDDKGKELLEFELEEVKAIGRVREDEEGTRIITVDDYEVVGDESSEDDDDDDDDDDDEEEYGDTSFV